MPSTIGTGEQGFAGDGGPAADARLNLPFDLVIDAAGNLLFADTFNHRIRKVSAVDGVITTVVGGGKKGFAGDGGPAMIAQLDEPYGLALSPEGDLYFADRLNRRVRKVDGKTGIIKTIAGDGSAAGSGDGGPAAEAGLVEPNGVALDGKGRLFIADVGDNRIRVVALDTGLISGFAGTGKAIHAGDGGPASLASIAGARAVAIGHDGVVYVLERQGNTLRAVDPADGLIRTIAGTGAKGYSGDGGPALAATFNGPKELKVDGSGNVLIVDTENDAIRRYDAATRTISTVAGGLRRDKTGTLGRPHGVAAGWDGTLFIGDTENHRILCVPSDKIAR
ncbi:hypothetical protein EP7_001470 [Isosphaeraceae bacterium EP7]